MERLSQTSEARKFAAEKEVSAIFPGSEVVHNKDRNLLEELKERDKNISVQQSSQTVPFGIKSFRSQNEENQSDDNDGPSELDFNEVQRSKTALPGTSDMVTEVSKPVSPETHSLPGKTDVPAVANVPKLASPKSHHKEQVKSEGDTNELPEESHKSIKDKSEDEASGKYRSIIELAQKLAFLQEQSAKMRLGVEDLKRQEKVLMEELTEKTQEVEHLEDEHGLLRAAVETACDGERPGEFYLEELNNHVQAQRTNIAQLESQWETFKLPLEDEKKSLKESLHEQKSEIQEEKVHQIALEVKAIESEISKRKEEHSKLCAELKNQPKLASRKSYIHRITEITKNSRKQDADIERILQDTRQLQIESNSIQDRLHRTYTVVDETVFRDAKNDSTRRQAYRLLTSLHQSFGQISEKILATDRVRREATELEAKLSAMASRSFDIDKLQVDLNAIRKENDRLEEQVRHA